MASEDKNRVIQTRQFGELVISPQHVFHFPEGIIGFEDLKDYVLVSDESSEPITWLISISNPDVGFPLLSPWYIDENYDAGKEVRLSRQIPYVIITLSKTAPFITANMRAPIILDVESQQGKQAILTSDRYSAAHVIGAQPGELTKG